MIRNRKQPMTLDRLAGAIQVEFLALRNEINTLRDDMNAGFAKTATKQDLAELREEIHEKFASRSELYSAIAGLREELLEEIGKIKYAKEIDELRARMSRVEQDLGFAS